MPSLPASPRHRDNDEKGAAAPDDSTRLIFRSLGAKAPEVKAGETERDPGQAPLMRPLCMAARTASVRLLTPSF